MKEDGFLSVDLDERDWRFVKITITDQGREFVRRNIPVAQEIVDQVMSSISHDDACRLEKLLKVVRQNAYNGFKRLSESP